MPTDDPPDARAQARARVAELLEARFGPHWRPRLGSALGMAQPAVSRLFSPPAGRTDRPSPALQALAEILAVTPDEKLPPRWGAGR